MKNNQLIGMAFICLLPTLSFNASSTEQPNTQAEPHSIEWVEKKCGPSNIDSMAYILKHGTVSEIRSPEMIAVIPEGRYRPSLITLPGIDAYPPGTPEYDAAIKYMKKILLNKKVDILLPNWDDSSKLNQGQAITASIAIGNKSIGLSLIISGLVKYKTPELYKIRPFEQCWYREEAKEVAKKRVETDAPADSNSKNTGQ